MAQFWVNSLVSARAQVGLVQLHHQDWTIQLDTATARQIAGQILEAAEAADHDAFMVTFAREALELREDQAVDYLSAFRKWRQIKRAALKEGDSLNDVGKN